MKNESIHKKKFRIVFLVSGMAVQAPAMVPTATATTFQKPGQQTPPPPIIFPGPNPNDLQLQSRVQLEIQSQVRNFNLSRQMILSNNGEVTLEGTVASREEYNLMERAANQV
ncbi:MAG: hypothetical protein ACXVAX_05280, partial [Pseudobdellovibrio sp.]